MIFNFPKLNNINNNNYCKTRNKITLIKLNKIKKKKTNIIMIKNNFNNHQLINRKIIIKNKNLIHNKIKTIY
jgi:hypothetical protein